MYVKKTKQIYIHTCICYFLTKMNKYKQQQICIYIYYIYIYTYIYICTSYICAYKHSTQQQNKHTQQQ